MATTIRKLVNQIVYEIKNRDDLVKSNRAMDKTADKAELAAKKSRKLERFLFRLGFRAGRVARRFGGLTRSVLGFAKANIGRVAGLGVISLGALGVAGITAANRIDKVGKAAEKLGISVSDFDALTQAAELGDVSFEAMEKTIQKMLKSVFDANKGLTTAQDAFDILGIDTRKAKDTGPVELIKQIADGLEKIPDQTTRVGVAMDIFGRSGADALRLLQNGGEEFEKLIDRVSEGGLITAEDAKRAAEFNDSLGILRNRLRRVRDIIGAGVFPAFVRLFDGISKKIADNVDRIREWSDSLERGITGFIDGGGMDRLLEKTEQFVALLGEGVKLAGQVVDALTFSDRERRVRERYLAENPNALRVPFTGIPILSGKKEAEITARIERDFALEDQGLPSGYSQRKFDIKKFGPFTRVSRRPIQQEINISVANGDPKTVERAVEQGVSKGNRRIIIDTSRGSAVNG